MQIIRRSTDRGHANHGWLNAKHSFSFANYYDPEWMGFSGLRVLNEDRISPDSGFPSDPHRDMEIITYVLSGEIEHRDNTGAGGVLRHGEIQVMSAGTGIVHSEFNPSTTEELHLLQIWIEPNERGVTPRYDQRQFPIVEKQGKLVLLAAPPDVAQDNNALTIHTDALVYAAQLGSGNKVGYKLGSGRSAWLQVAHGEIELGGDKLAAGDGVAVSDEKAIEFKASGKSELLLFDLAGS